MECNKDEAIRARGIAQHKMQNNDFEGAKRIALRAQKLFPDLENITQLLTVCHVHHCAKHKIYGSEMDWYGILQLERSSDEGSIKKQYRKLALLLHPDKNKFAGAEAAFKLIVEANTVLTDQTKRSRYDTKTAPKPTAHPSNTASTSSVGRQYKSTNNSQSGCSGFAAQNDMKTAPKQQNNMKTAPKPTTHPSKTTSTASVDRQYKSTNNSQNGCSDFAAQNDMKTAPKPTPHPSNGASAASINRAYKSANKNQNGRSNFTAQHDTRATPKPTPHPSNGASAASAGWQNQSSNNNQNGCSNSYQPACHQWQHCNKAGSCSNVKMPTPNVKEGKKGVKMPKPNAEDGTKGVKMPKSNERDVKKSVVM
ncbi:hypothetical protein V6N13_114315 [Hibiscus sabdariffa]|uniref:J domain-containing protein n=1 Tax=Hibiscus sabdariffa TaxID=183260 RepID=A0ABR2U1E5_9ROSI